MGKQSDHPHHGFADSLNTDSQKLASSLLVRYRLGTSFLPFRFSASKSVNYFTRVLTIFANPIVIGFPTGDLTQQ